MTTKPQTLLPLPDPPEHEPDDMTSVQHLGENGNLHHLAQYLGNQDTTIVSGERFIVPTPGTPSSQRISPDLLISFNANPALYRQDNSYVISRQGKPPDLVMEIASRRTGETDVEAKGETLELEADHRRHAEIENAIRDLKYGVGLNHLPSGRFAANSRHPGPRAPLAASSVLILSPSAHRRPPLAPPKAPADPPPTSRLPEFEPGSSPL